jgi:hypothetical protein
MKKNRTTSIFIFSIVTAVLVVGLFVFCLRIIKNKNQHTSAVLFALQEKMKEKENATMFAERVSEIQNTKELINSYFVDVNKIDAFVGYLEDIGTNTGASVVVKGIEIAKENKDNISFRLEIVGTFQDVMESVSLLENIPYQVNISQVYLNKNIEQSVIETKGKVNALSNPTWQADVSFNILSHR